MYFKTVNFMCIWTQNKSSDVLHHLREKSSGKDCREHVLGYPEINGSRVTISWNTTGLKVTNTPSISNNKCCKSSTEGGSGGEVGGTSPKKDSSSQVISWAPTSLLQGDSTTRTILFKHLNIWPIPKKSKINDHILITKYPPITNIQTSLVYVR